MFCESYEIGEDWYKTAFGALYPVLYAHRTVDAARPEARFAGEALELARGERVLDLCCGTGRHMVHFLERTPEVVGLDFSPELLRIARATVGPGARLLRGDMRTLPFDGAFDAVVNFFTSFGYFFSKGENLEVVRGVARALKSGGRFFIDYLNRAYAERTLVPESVRERDGCVIRETRWIDRDAQRINKTTVVSKNGEPLGRTSESVRLYDLEEFRALLHAGGLHVERGFGDYAGAPLDEARPRMIVAGRKGAAP